MHFRLWFGLGILLLICFCSVEKSLRIVCSPGTPYRLIDVIHHNKVVPPQQHKNQSSNTTWISVFSFKLTYVLPSTTTNFISSVVNTCYIFRSYK